MLTLSEGTQGFIVYYDACIIGLGCVLLKDVNVITYAYIHLKFHEKNYPTYDLELLVAVFA